MTLQKHHDYQDTTSKMFGYMHIICNHTESHLLDYIKHKMALLNNTLNEEEKIQEKGFVQEKLGFVEKNNRLARKHMPQALQMLMELDSSWKNLCKTCNDTEAKRLSVSWTTVTRDERKCSAKVSPFAYDIQDIKYCEAEIAQQLMWHTRWQGRLDEWFSSGRDMKRLEQIH